MLASLGAPSPARPSPRLSGSLNSRGGEGLQGPRHSSCAALPDRARHQGSPQRTWLQLPAALSTAAPKAPLSPAPGPAVRQSPSLAPGSPLPPAPGLFEPHFSHQWDKADSGSPPRPLQLPGSPVLPSHLAAIVFRKGPCVPAAWSRLCTPSCSIRCPGSPHFSWRVQVPHQCPRRILKVIKH